MSDLRELYQDIIMDHNKNPQNFHKLENATKVIDGTNPLCGDHYTIYLVIENDIIKDICFDGAGCAISKASGSVMTTILKGKPVKEAEELFKKFHDVVTGSIKFDDAIFDLGKLGAFAGVAEFPSRVKCASLAWHAMHEGISNDTSEVSTE
jgi:nitrogen fixation protein NifU and related proteins